MFEKGRKKLEAKTAQRRHTHCVDLPVFTELGSPLVGFFTQISTLADVQENVMEYLHVLSRPKVIDQEHDVVWTEAYIDSTVSLLGP